MKIIMHFDGACEPTNPGGNMGIGCMARCGDELLMEHSHFVPAARENSNNVAEYMALIAGLEWLIKKQYNRTEEHRITIFGDSQLVIKQMSGQWKIKFGRYKPFALQARELLSTFITQPTFKWVPREMNEDADVLSKAGMIKNNVEFKLQKQ